MATRWTQPGSDDCFLVLDATAMRTAGLDVRDASLAPVDGLVLMQGGLSISPLGSVTPPASDVWDVAAMLDSNHDGQIDAADPAYEFTYLYMGAPDMTSLRLAQVNQELHRPPVALLTWGTSHAAPVHDAFGNLRSDGVALLAGQPRVVTGVTLFGSQPTGSKRTTWGAVRRIFR
jgi:hypothetical protein